MTNFKKVTTSKQAKTDSRVDDIFTEYGNLEYGKQDWFIYLKEGWVCRSMRCATIHAKTLKECLHLLNTDVITEETFTLEIIN